jgi:ABC-type sugar transport system ATPase subunit
MKDIYKEFPGVVALKNITFKVRRGTIHALVGENGAGKSTLMKILSGIYQAEKGEIYLNNEHIRIASPQDAIKKGISMVYQELNTVPEMTIAENLFLGREPKKHGYVDKKQLYVQAKKQFEQFDLDFDVKAPMKTLSIANAQMVEIIRALSRNAKIIVFDEPTSSISDREANKLFDFIERMKKDGMTVIYISHKMEEISRIADEVTILRDGETIDTKLCSEISMDEIIAKMVGRKMEEYYPEKTAPCGDVVLKVENLCKEGVFENISFEVRAGEILGFAGLIGAGRTEVMSCIFGMMDYDSGSIYINGKKVKNRNTREAIQNGVALVPEDRKKLGLVLCRSIGENITLPFLRSYNSFNLKIKKETKDINHQMKQFAVKANDYKTLANTLSGGNQQKVVLAKWMLENPNILILDEPTRGIDIGAKHEIYQYMCELAQKEIAIIMISSEMPEVLGMSDRIVVMAEGRISGEVLKENATSETIMRYAMEGV